MLDLYDELRDVARTFESNGLTYALIGGLAVSVYARPRATEDIDFLVLPEEIAQISAALVPLGYTELATPMRFAGGRIEIRRFTKVEGNDYMVLDLLLASDAQLRDVLARRLPSGEGDSRLWLAPVDGLRCLKRLRGSAQDLADIEALGAEDE